MKQYHDFAKHILENGIRKTSRTGIDTISVFGYQLRFDLSDGFPLITTKEIHWKSIIHELLWFLKGETNVKYLNDRGVTFWNHWADNDGNLGRIYGAQWVSWQTPDNRTVNQIADVVDRIRRDPDSRRHVVSAWNVADLPGMALEPCHVLFQFYVDRKRGTLSCHLYQRSADVFIGVPFNIASYALLTMMVAQVTGYKPGDFIHSFGDAHLYVNHLDQIRLQLGRVPYSSPFMYLNNKIEDVFDFTIDDFVLANYVHHDFISAPVAV